ncbi:MAG: peptidyl-prolyl cis-trans isomerase, partial [Treponema sp.]|nr:peptidyl-prolyl cis-trans isomerase [Treponema sp.]
KASFVWNDMIKLFMIIVPKEGNADAALSKANDLRNKLIEKKLTTDQMTVQSKIEGSGYQAGELLLPKTNIGADSVGMSYQGLLLLFEQNEGFITDVQETSLDYRTVVVGKKYSAKMLSISDVVQPETTVTVYEYIRSNLAQQKQMLYVQQAAQEIADSLNKPEYVEEKKTGAALDKLLAWETN